MKNHLLASLLFVAACASDDPPADMVAPELGVSSISSARVIRGRTTEVAIEIQRNAGVVGPITIEVDGLPAGVVASPLEIAEGETTGVLLLTGTDSIALGTKPMVVLRASAGETVVEQKMQLRLTDRPGTPDKTFGVNGLASWQYASMTKEDLRRVAVQPDGKIVAAGRSDTYGITLVTRFNADGSVDKEFGDGGSYPGATANEDVIGIAVRPDGVILVVTALETASSTIKVLAPTGYLLDTIVLNAATTGGEFTARSMVAQPDGSMHILGARGSDSAVIHVDAEGTLDTAFDGDGVAVIDLGGSELAFTLLRRPDGRLVITGFAENGFLHYGAARLHADGSPDASFGGDGVVMYDSLPVGGFLSSSLLPDGRVAAMASDGVTTKVSMVTIEEDSTIDMSKALPMSMFAMGTTQVTDGTLAIGGYATGGSFAVMKFGTGGVATDFGVDGVMNVVVPDATAHLAVSGVQVDEDRALAVGAYILPGDDGQQSVLRFWL